MALIWNLFLYSNELDAFLYEKKGEWSYSEDIGNAINTGTYFPNWLDLEVFLAANPQLLALQPVWIADYKV